MDSDSPKETMNLTSFPLILTEGGDDRLKINPKTGVNKYFCTPEYEPDVLFRGSCTCNMPSELGYAAAKDAYEKLVSEKETIDSLLSSTRSRLHKMYELQEGTGVFLMPSGSDAEYIPLLIAKTLNEGKQIVSVVSCDEEVGSGTLDAAGGRLFSAVEPIPGYTEGKLKVGDKVEGLAENVRTVSIKARNSNGVKIESKPQIEEVLTQCRANNEVPIIHAVYGSKTGIQEEYPEDLQEEIRSLNGLIVVDACQGRFQIEKIRSYLDQGAIILITGSKFYRGPPFCGAVLIARSIMNDLAQCTTGIPQGLKAFFGKKEIPSELTAWRDSSDASVNVGLALRWQAALAEIEPTLAIIEEERFQFVALWREYIIEQISKYPDLVYFSRAKDTDSILSVRFKHPDPSKTYMNKTELTKIFSAMPEDKSNMFPTEEAMKYRCFIGQPVVINKDEAVLRIALGSDSLRAFITNREKTNWEDAMIIKKLALLRANYSQL